MGGELPAPNKRTEAMDAIESALANAEPAEPLLTLRSRVTAYGGVEPVDEGDGKGCSVDVLLGIGI